MHRALGCWVLMVLLTASGVSASTDKASWITQSSNTLLTQMPRVDAFMWFNNYKPGASEPDWRVVPDAPNLPDMNVVTAYNNAWHDVNRSLSRGVFIDGAPPNTANLDHFELYLGHHDRVGVFESFASAFPLSKVQTIQSRNSRPYIVWQPYDDSIGYWARGNLSLLPLINSGQYDGTIVQWATAAKNNGGAMDIVFGHEMNGNWFNWGYLPDDYYQNGAPKLTDPNLIGHNGNRPIDFINAFQRIANIFNQAGATNVNFVWDVNADFSDNFTVSYPGLAYVDRMGMNGFNWGRRARDLNNAQWDDWRELEQIFGPWWPGSASTYSVLAGLNDLPIIIGEFGTEVPEPATVGLLAVGSLLLVRRRRR